MSLLLTAGDGVPGTRLTHPCETTKKTDTAEEIVSRHLKEIVFKILDIRQKKKKDSDF